MRTVILAIIFALPSFLHPHGASCQERLTISIQGPVGDGAVAQVYINGLRYMAAFDNAGVATLEVEGAAKVNIEIHVSYPGMMIVGSWGFSRNLNGSGRLYLDLNRRSGKAIGREWPAITFQAEDDTLEIVVDGNRRGHTVTTRGVQPNVRHVLRWRKAGILRCEKTVELPFDVHHVYICNRDGVVAESYLQ